jgi:squalene-hopene/tetraprenyl-beta-curcumene cyclase
MLTICGVIPAEALNSIPALPYELALLPPSWYNAVNLRVVSYALPALIGVGIYLHRHRKKLFPGCGIFRNRFVAPAMRKLESIMPESGGFLEAPPLTGFVCMCLVKAI